MKWNNKKEFKSPNIKLTNEYQNMINNDIDKFLDLLQKGQIQQNCLSPQQNSIINKYRSKINRKNGKEALLVLFKFLNEYKLLLLILSMVTIVSTVMNVLAIFTMYYLQSSFPNDMKEFDVARFCIFAACGIIFYFFNAFTMWWQTRTMAKLSQKVGYKIRRKLFYKIQKLPVKYFDQNSSGDLMSRFTNDVNNITNAMSENLTVLINGIFLMISMFITMFLLSPYLALITIAIIPFMIVSILSVVNKARPSFAKNQKYIGELNGYAEEVISGQSIINLYKQEDNINGIFKQYNDRLKNESIRAQSFSSTIFPIALFYVNLSSAIITLAGILFIINGVGSGFNGVSLPSFGATAPASDIEASIATYTTFLLVSRQFFIPFAQISNVTNILLMAIAGANRSFKVLFENNEITEDEHIILNIDKNNKNVSNQIIDKENTLIIDSEADIGVDDVKNKLPFEKVSTNDSVKVKNLDFSYVPHKQILFDINIDVKPGQTIAIVGPTGSGKSTFINLLTKFYDIHKGDILIGDKKLSIKEITKMSMRNNVSIVLQDTFLFNVNIMDNIRYGRLDATEQEIIDAAITANAHNFIMQLPDGYNTVLNDNGESLSQGQRQLLAIARAVLSTSNILILDEATSSIDTKTEQEIQNAMLKLTKNKTSFVIAHRLSTIEKADLILVLKNGVIIERGTHDELIKYKGFYYELHNSQFYEDE